MTPATAPVLEPRERILGVARHPLADGGVHAMTMRGLATACSLAP